MSQLSNRDAIRNILADVERAVVLLDRTRTQTAVETYQSAKELLLEAIECVAIGARIAE